MSRVIDLDVIAPPDITVRAQGQDYLLPGDVPIPQWLGIVQAAERFEAGEDGAMEDTYQRVLELFQVRQPGLEALPIGVRQLVALIFGLYGQSPEEDSEDPPPTPPRGGSTPKKSNGSKGKAKTRSRSSS